FMYIAIFGSFLTIYWLVRLLQHVFKMPGRTLFYFITLAMSLAGVAALIMYAIIAITLYSHPTLEARIEFIRAQLPLLLSGSANQDFTMFVAWSLLLAAGVVALVVGTALAAYKRGVPVRDIVILLLLVLAFCLILIVVEELTFISARLRTADPAVPEAGDSIVTSGQVNNTPIIAA
ncbi:MAG: hypothetical protein CUN53_19380, partial [Phototrophicales bacterium]